MNRLFPYPFVRLIIPLLAGIIAGTYSDILFSNLLVPVVLLWFCLAAFMINPDIFPASGRKYQYLLFVLSIVFLIGYYLSAGHFREIQYQMQNGNGNKFLLEISSPPLEKEKSIKVSADVFNVSGALNSSGSFCGKGLFYFEKDSLSLAIDMGDRLLLNMHLYPAENNGNPGEFDYRSYLNRRGILWRQFVAKENWFIVVENSGEGISSAIISYRNQILLKLRNAGLGQQDLSVAAAMLLGYDEILDRQTRASFADAGAMHILCVSGLHVGIIYMVLNFLLSFFKKIRGGGVLQILIILILIWLYAGLTGFQAPVLRASVMFSFLAFANLLNRKAYAFNTLAASAFFILLMEPMALFNAGFQLSYAAVFFIVWLHGPLYGSIPVKYYAAGKIWSLCCVSIAATVGTLPLVIHYFNQFPLYFLFSNIFAVPLSFMIVGSGIIFMLFPYINPLTSLIGKILHILLQLLNHLVSIIQNLPNARIEGLYLDEYESLLLYFLIFLLAAALKFRKISILKYVLAAFMLLLLNFRCNELMQKRERNITIYNTGKGTAIDLIDGNKHYFLTDSSVFAGKYIIDYNIKGNWLNKKLTSAGSFSLNTAYLRRVNESVSCSRNVIVFNNYKLLIFDDNCPDGFNDINFDAALLKRGVKIEIDSFCLIFKCPVWIIDPSVSAYKSEKLKKKAEDAGIIFHELKNGAYIHQPAKTPFKP